MSSAFLGVRWEESRCNLDATREWAFCWEFARWEGMGCPRLDGGVRSWTVGLLLLNASVRGMMDALFGSVLNGVFRARLRTTGFGIGGYVCWVTGVEPVARSAGACGGGRTARRTRADRACCVPLAPAVH